MRDLPPSAQVMPSRPLSYRSVFVWVGLPMAFALAILTAVRQHGWTTTAFFTSDFAITAAAFCIGAIAGSIVFILVFRALTGGE